MPRIETNHLEQPLEIVRSTEINHKVTMYSMNKRESIVLRTMSGMDFDKRRIETNLQVVLVQPGAIIHICKERMSRT